MKITILVNTLQAVSSVVYSNHIAFFIKSAKTDPTTEFIFFTPHRMSIDTARNQAAKIALETQSDYLMFIDDDVLIPPNTLELLLKANKDIIAGLVIIRGKPFHPMAFKSVGEDQLTFYDDLPLIEPCKEGHINYDINCKACHETYLQELVEVGAIGFSCALIKCDVLTAMEPPYFITGVVGTEDVYFCIKSRELDPKPSIYLHTGVKCGHLLNQEPIEWASRKKMQDFYDEVSPNPAHGIDYIDKCLAKIK